MATPYRSDDLIADARERAETLRRVFPDDGEVWDDARLIESLADALEAAEAARDAALAVIENVRGLVELGAIDNERQAWITPSDNPYRQAEEESND